MHIGTTSQAGQDMFAHFISGRISHGGFVDIGCHDARFHSNSASLEHVGWIGVLVDIIPGVCAGRRSPFVCCDATNPNAELLERYSTLPPVLGYLSVDCDDATFQALKVFPFDRVQCQSVTVEHDRYRVGDSNRNAIRQFMQGMGYELVCSDVVAPGYGQFEDWFCFPEWSSRGTRDRIRCVGKEWKDMKT